MRLTKVYVRFYKSFNFDYERKFGRTSEPDPWEFIEDAWYPYVRIDVEPTVTTIVGANESGKSHLLDAIEKAISGEGIEAADFCRYSRYFSVERGERRAPDFGVEVEAIDVDDTAQVKEALGVDLQVGDRFNMFRANGQPPQIYLAGANEPSEAPKKPKTFATMLPRVFRLDRDLALPDSIPLYALIDDANRSYGSREARRSITEAALGRAYPSAEEFAKAAAGWFGIVSTGAPERSEQKEVERQHNLARALLLNVANVDPTTFKDLSDAIADGKEGYASGVIQKINESLAKHLNFPRWWAQDREFRLLVSRSEYDLVFTIRDRTGTDYSFAERSSGLKYFLSYHIQLLAHESSAKGQSEILLMDEPDAYLSSQGQHDLLRILEDFALPEDLSRHDQVLYVTHSPFLINRNAGQRIRVLDKGMTDEGTRVVKDVARNHYEPLRSSLGAFVAETSFIGGSNLFVEGLADQVLLAGISSHLLAKGAPKTDTLDLNTVTIVPSGSASSIPYLVYLARGRDVVRPASVVLLDSDAAGDDAADAIKKGGPRRKELLAKEFVVRLGAWAKSLTEKITVANGVVVTELEDLISLPVAVAAAQNYAVKVVEVPRGEAERLSVTDVERKLEASAGSLYDAVEAAFREALGPGVHIEKIGFAKEVVAVLDASRGMETPAMGVAEIERNFAMLLTELARVLRRADQQEQDRRLSNRLNRTISGFLDDYQSPTTRERGRNMIEEVVATLEKSDAGDRVRLRAEKIRRDFELDEDLTRPIERYTEFRELVEGLRYQERLATQDSKTLVPVSANDAATHGSSAAVGPTSALRDQASAAGEQPAHPAGGGTASDDRG